MAKLLGDIGRHRDALPLWQRLASPGRLGHDTSRLIDCALRVGEHGLFLALCEQLRANEIYDSQLIEVEAGVRGQYDTEGTVRLLQEHLSRSPHDHGARLHLSVIGLQLGRSELVSSDPASMPPSDDTAPQNWKTIVLVMRSGGHLWEALRFAYRLLRSNFGNVEAHRAYFAALLTTGPRPEIPTVDVAGPGTAVAFREERASQVEWRVIEEECEPISGIQELSPDHFIAQQLTGKRVGDIFLVAQGSVVSTRATIVQILSKYVYRFQDCGNNWQKRFPDHPDIQSIRVSKLGAGGKEEVDFTEFFQGFDRIVAHQHEAIEVYRTQPISIHLLARSLNFTEFEQTIRLAVDDSVRFRCCSGNAEERAGAVSALKNASEIVLDLTALSTLLLLDGLDNLQQFQSRLLISESTLAEMRRVLEEHVTEGGETGFGREGHRYVISEVSPEAVRSHRQFFEAAIEKVKSYCGVVGCPEFAAVPADRRDYLVKGLGEHGAQSIVLASAPGRILWTDDYVVAVLSAHEFGVRRVWTQVALQERVEAGAIEPNVFIDATAKLLGWKYHFTSPSVPALASAGSMASWNPDRWPLKGALEVYGDTGILTRDILQLALAFILHFAREVVLPEVRSTISIRILEQLARRGEGLAPIGVLLRALPGAFGLDVIRANELIQVVNAWIASKRRIRRDF